MNFNQSKVKSFRRCQKAYSFEYDYADEGFELKPKYPSLPLKIGSWLHTLQEAYHREWAVESGFDPELVYDQERWRGEEKERILDELGWKAAHRALTEEFDKLFVEEKEIYGDIPDQAYRLFTSYLRHWEKEGDKERYKIAALHDGRPAIEFLVQQPLSKSHMFKGRIDVMVEDAEYGGLWIWDAKWVKSLPKPDERMMSPQSLMYVWGQRKAGYDVRGFVFNYGRKKPPTIPPLLKKGFLTTRHSLDTDVYTYLREIKRTHGGDWKKLARTYYADKIEELKARHNDWFRRERIPTDPARIAKALKEFGVTAKDILRRDLENPPRTYIPFSCPFMCDYHDLCVSEFNGLDISGLIKANFVQQEERYVNVES